MKAKNPTINSNEKKTKVCVVSAASCTHCSGLNIDNRHPLHCNSMNTLQCILQQLSVRSICSPCLIRVRAVLQQWFIVFLSEPNFLDPDPGPEPERNSVQSCQKT